MKEKEKKIFLLSNEAADKTQSHKEETIRM